MRSAQAAAADADDKDELSRQAQLIVMRQWAAVDPDNISDSWRAALSDAIAAITAAQEVAAEFADPYLSAAVSGSANGYTVNAGAFAGTTQTGEALDSLLFLPVVDAKQAIAAGAPAPTALKQAANQVAMYVQTLVSDAGRLSTAAAMGARPKVAGYYRMLTPPSCSRCAVLAGKFFLYNQGFARHPRCDCRHVPVAQADDSLAFDARKAIEAGQVTGLSKAETTAIVDYGADPSQVVNIHAKGSLYTADGMRFARAGTTLRSVAGARLAAQEIARAAGEQVEGRFFTNFTIDRRRVAAYQQTLRRGKVYTRTTQTGRTQRYAYTRTAGRRLTPEQILADAPNRTEAIRQLVNHGYILDLRDTAAALARDVRLTVPARTKKPSLGKFHLPGDDVADLATASRTAAATRSKLSGGQSADTELVTLPDGRKFVTKRGSDWGDTSPEMQADVRHQAEAEQLASLVGRAIGAPVVRVYRSSWDRVWMPFEDGRLIGDLSDAEVRRHVDSRDGKLLGLLDHLIGNSDRNGGNILVHNGRLVGIDHGWSWTPHGMQVDGAAIQDEADRPASHYSRNQHWIGNPLTLHDIRVLRDRLDALRPQFDHIGRGTWLDYTLLRLQLLARHATGAVNLIG